MAMSGEQFFEILRTGDAPRVADALHGQPELAGARDASGLSAAMWTLYNRKPELTPLLLAKNPPLDVFESAALGRAADVEAHVARDPACAKSYAADGFTPLHLAAFFSRLEVARLLVQRGAEASAVARNPSRVEPLHSASAAGHLAIVELLLEAGADPNARQHGGFTALHSAAMQGNLPIIRTLMVRGADPSLKADDGRSALDLAGDRADVQAALQGRP
jgi:hypothetical protein